MKILTATSLTQGNSPGDYNWCHDGELVCPPTFICDRDAKNPDQGCGCGRGWSGLNTHKATTSAQVSVVGIDLDDYIEAIRSSLTQGGWDDGNAEVVARQLAEIAASYPVGTVFGHRLGDLYVRAIPPTTISVTTDVV